MLTRREDPAPRPRLFGRAEWIGLAFFVGAGLLALPFVSDAILLQRFWLSICSAVGLSG